MASLRVCQTRCHVLMTEEIGIIHLSGKDVVRHPVVARILMAYESNSKTALPTGQITTNQVTFRERVGRTVRHLDFRMERADQPAC